MAETVTLQVLENGYRNVVIRGALVSDGSGVASQVIFNATSSGIFGVNQGGQIFYPGIYTKIIGMDFDVQDQKFKLEWEASSNSLIMALGTSPEDFNWTRSGGITVPTGLTGATGSILLSTIDPMPNATLFFMIYLRKGVPQT